MSERFAYPIVAVLSLVCAIDASACCPKQVSLDVRPESEQAAAEAINTALNSPVRFEFAETPLADVVEFLRKLTGVQVILDHKALEGVGIGSDTPITLSLSNVSLRSALKIMLRQLELTFMVADEVLLITTPEEVETRLIMRVYPVLELVVNKSAEDTEEDFDSLIQVIVSTVAPQSWEDVGGAGSIAPFPNAKALVCSQTGEIHEQIETLLTTLRKARCVQGIGDQQPVPPPSPKLAEPGKDPQSGRDLP